MKSLEATILKHNLNVLEHKWSHVFSLWIEDNAGEMSQLEYKSWCRVLDSVRRAEKAEVGK